MRERKGFVGVFVSAGQVSGRTGSRMGFWPGFGLG